MDDFFKRAAEQFHLRAHSLDNIEVFGDNLLKHLRTGQSSPAFESQLGSFFPDHYGPHATQRGFAPDAKMGILLTIAAYRLAHDTRPDAAPTGFAINVLKNSVSYFADCGDIRQIEIWGKLHSALSRIPDMSDSARTLAFNAAIPQRITERNMPFLKEAAERWGEALDRWIHGGDQEGYETRLKTGGPNAARRALGHLDQLNAPADFPLRIVAANRIASYKAGEIPTPPVERPGYLAAFVGLLKRAASLGRA